MSQPPEHPGNPNDPWGGNPNPGDYPPPGYGPPPGPPPGYGPPPGTAAARLRTAAGVWRTPAAPGLRAAAHRGTGRPPATRRRPATDPRPATRRLRATPPPPGHGFDIGDAFSWAWNKFRQERGAADRCVAGVLRDRGGRCTVWCSCCWAAPAHHGHQRRRRPAVVLRRAGRRRTFSCSSSCCSSSAFSCRRRSCPAPSTLPTAGRWTLGPFFKPRNFGAVFLAAVLLAVISAS